MRWSKYWNASYVYVPTLLRTSSTFCVLLARVIYDFKAWKLNCSCLCVCFATMRLLFNVSHLVLQSCTIIARFMSYNLSCFVTTIHTLNKELFFQTTIDHETAAHASLFLRGRHLLPYSTMSTCTWFCSFDRICLLETFYLSKILVVPSFTCTDPGTVHDMSVLQYCTRIRGLASFVCGFIIIRPLYIEPKKSIVCIFKIIVLFM